MSLFLCVSVYGLGATESDSTDDPRLQKMLQRYPEADANGDGLLTPAEAKAFKANQRQVSQKAQDKSSPATKRPKPTFADVTYGPHERNVLDLYQAKSGRPTPVVVYIHGGGFKGGDKKSVDPAVIAKCLTAGVSVAAINYRFRQQAPIQDILRDAARAIQFLRHKSGEFNLDKTRIVAFGGSAGAGTSLWLAFHDDLADPNSKDPVLRESSRLAAAGSINGQFSYDFEQWPTVIGKYPGNQPAPVGELHTFYGLKDADDIHSSKGKQIRADVDMLALLTKDDPPVFLYSAGQNVEPTDHGHYVHHPRHSIAVKHKCDQVGVECKMLLRADDPSISRDVAIGRMLEFFFKHVSVLP
jgi:acetyl esterase/lipase